MTEIFLNHPSLRWALLMLLFLAVALASYAIAALLGERGAIRERLSPGASAGQGDQNQGSTLIPGTLRADRTQGMWTSLIGAIEKSGIPLVDTKDVSLRSKLIAAGFSSPLAPRAYSLIRLGLLIGLPVLLFLYLAMTGQRPSIGKLYFLAMFAAILGMYAPVVYVRFKAGSRQQELINGFPDALDLMLVHQAARGAAWCSCARATRRTHPRGCLAADGRPRRC
jgi:tight adherence protein C